MRSLALALAVAVAASLSLAGAAHAAQPSTGVFAPPDKLTLKWSGEAAGYGVGLFEPVARLNCRQPFCDGYVFTVPQGLPADSVVDVTLTALESTGFTDVFVTEPNGTKTYYEGEGGNPATTATLPDPVAGDWLVQVYTNAPAYLTTGSYKGQAKLTLPAAP